MQKENPENPNEFISTRDVISTKHCNVAPFISTGLAGVPPNAHLVMDQAKQQQVTTIPYHTVILIRSSNI